MARPTRLTGAAAAPDDRSGMPARLHIDWTRCDGRGLCTELLAGRLARDEWGYPVAITPGAPIDGTGGGTARGAATGTAAGAATPASTAYDRSNVPIPAGELDAAADAVALCPRQALRLVVRAEP